MIIRQHPAAASRFDAEDGGANPLPLQIPDALWKATQDPFDYLLCLRNGTKIAFSEAVLVLSDDREHGLVVGEWVTLAPNDWSVAAERVGTLPCPAPRGVEVRLSDIVWVSDAPFGS